MNRHVFILLTVITLFAQMPRTTAFFGGATINTLDSDNSLHKDVNDFHIGMRYTQYNRFGLALEMIYDNKSFSSTYLIGNSSYDSDVTLKYLTISPQIEGKIDYGFFYFVGPAFGYQVSSSIKNSLGEDQFNSDFSNSFRLSGIAGFGYRINDYMIRIAYDYGFTDQLRDGTSTVKSRFSGFQLGIAIFAR